MMNILKLVEAFGVEVIKLGMPMIVDLGEGEHVRIENEGRAIQINILKGGMGRAHSPGVIRLERVGISDGNVWEVVNSGAKKGYGPLLYDIGMEVVCNVVGDLGIMPDARVTSDSARRIWDVYYGGRGDVGFEKLPEERFIHVGGRPKSLKNYYYKVGSPILDRLGNEGKIEWVNF